jgi:hypothetical protein
VILITGVLFYCKSCIRVEVVAKYRFSVPSYSDPQLNIFKCFFEVNNRSVQRAFVFIKNEKERHGNGSGGSRRADITGSRKRRINMAEQRGTGIDEESKGGEVLRRRRQERQLYNEIVVKACVLKYIKDP